ncbi:hypothetical protein PsYK624_034580 [Phanerochaete sordida]|uniref:Uncharacterized protein n=1 Tax=Phanerochaete sordida TaxID=48140 RepID=A0A9P3G4D3_9APHY|nr:hypothetical protein PsYK624_034580 [Phanerochaete sordida]
MLDSGKNLATPQALASLERILIAWRDGSMLHVPPQVLHLLEHRVTFPQGHSDGTFNYTPDYSSLTGADALKVRALEGVAAKHGFGLRLVGANLFISGTGFTDPGDQRQMPKCTFNEVNEKESYLKNFVRLDGTVIDDEQSELDERMAIPRNLFDAMEDQGPDDQEFDEWDEEEHRGTIFQSYFRTLLVIWPPWSAAAVDPAGAFARLDSAKGADEGSLSLVRGLIRSGDPKSIQAVCGAACRWNDAQLWNDALSASDVTTAAVPTETFLEGIRCFGFEAIERGLEAILRAADQDGHSSLLYLRDLLVHMDKAQGDSGAESAQDVRMLQWAGDQLISILEDMVGVSEFSSAILVGLARMLGGIPFVKKRLLSALASSAECTFVAKFAALIHADSELSDNTLVSTLLSSALAHVSPQDSLRTYDEAYFYLDICVATGQKPLLPALVDRALDVARLSYARQRAHVVEVMLPMVAHLAVYAPEMTECRHALRDAAVRMYFDRRIMHADVPAFGGYDPYVEWEAEAERMLQATVEGARGDTAYFFSSVAPKLMTAKLHDEALRDWTEELVRRRDWDDIKDSAAPAGVTLDQLIASLGARYGNSVLLKTASDVAFVLSHGVSVPEFRQSVLRRLTDTASLTPRYISDVLAPSLSELKALAADAACPPDVADSLRTIFNAWLDVVLGQPPPPEPAVTDALRALPAWKCECASCGQARAFLKQSDDKKLLLPRIGAPTRRHVKKEMRKYLVLVSSLETVKRAPQGLRIQKASSLVQLHQYRAKQIAGVKILTGLSTDDGKLRGLLGPVYDRALVALRTLKKHELPAAGSLRPTKRENNLTEEEKHIATDSGEEIMAASDERPAKKLKEDLSSEQLWASLLKW